MSNNRIEVTETFDKETGRVQYRVGRFTYTIDSYDDEYVTIHRDDDSICPEYVRSIKPNVKNKNLRYTSWEERCEVAYRAAELQARA